MTSAAVVGNGPTCLSAALFFASNGLSVAVYGDDHTDMRFALVNNYLRVPAVSGSEFQNRHIVRCKKEEQPLSGAVSSASRFPAKHNAPAHVATLGVGGQIPPTAVAPVRRESATW